MGLHWHEWGSASGPTLVFLHGFLGDGTDWLPLEKSFRNYRCLAPDLPGHGQSEFSEGLDLAQLTTQLSQEIIAKGVDQPIVIGYSMGGRVALQWVQNDPALIRGIVLESASPGIDSEIERRARHMFDLQVEKRLLEMAPGEFIDWWCGMPMFGNIKAHPDYASLRDKRSRYSSPQVIKVMKALGVITQPSMWPVLERLPVLGYLTGELDTKYRAVADRIQQTYSKIPVVVIGGVAHNCHFEAPDRVGNILLRFISDF